MSEMQKDSKEYTGYEYLTVHTDENKLSLCMDAYGDFGWDLDENRKASDEKNATIYLKRNRKIINKAELTRLQRHFEDCLKQLDSMENSKTSLASMYAIAIGIIGTAFMAGSTFAVTAQQPIVWLCILLAIPGFIGWIIPIFLYRYLVKKRTAVMDPLIGEKYDEIYEICEKGRKLL